MSMLCNDTISYLPERVSTRQLNLDGTSRLAAGHRGGYAFETALCLVESQSPRLRPVSAPPARAQLAPTARTRELSSRVRLLTNLLDGLRGQFDIHDRLLLLTAARQVTTELLEVFAPGADRLLKNPSADAFDRRVSTDPRAQASRLLDRIRSEMADLTATCAAA
jgi:hypothetical protein